MKSQRISKIIATLLLLTQVVCILPAEEIIQERNYGRARLEQYLSRAERERNAQDYERIAEEGLMLAMSEWESANTYLRETDYTTYEVEKAKVKTEYEKITAREYALWYVNKKLEDEAAVKSSELSKELTKKAEEYREKYKESGASEEESKQSEAEWENYANAIVENYMQELNANNARLVPELTEELKGYNEETIKGIYETVAKDYESRIYKEYERIYAAEKNQLMSELLYDTKSTKKLSATEAAEVIAKETAKEVKTETDQAMVELFNDFETTIEGIDGKEIELARENWLNNFEKVFNESIEKWNEAERKFLAERNEWETSASEVYEANEKAWAEGYKIIQEKRKAWFEDVEKKLVEGRKNWDESEERLNDQLNASYAELEITLAKEKESKNKMLDLQISIYEQSRTMLNMVASGLEGFAETFYGNYYNNRYAYWKTEDSNKIVDEFSEIVEKFKQNNKPGSFFSNDEEINKAISLVKKLQADCKNEEVKTVLSSLINQDGSSGWLQILKEYKSKTLEAKEALYRLTGCIYNGEPENPNDDLVYFNELDYEIIKAKVALEYWEEEFEVANSIKEYAEKTDSQTEIDKITKENIKKTIESYEAALSEYNKAVKDLSDYQGKVSDLEKVVNEEYQKLTEAKENLQAAKDAYSEILLVYLGVEASPLKDKITSLIVEYENKKSQPDNDEFYEYYQALVEYTYVNQKHKYLEMKINVENGTEGGTLSISKIEEYKEKTTKYIDEINLDSDSYLLQMTEYAAIVELYCGSTATILSQYIREYKDKKLNSEILEEVEFSETEKQEYESIILKYMQTIEEFWQRELTKKTETLYYLENGRFEEVAEIENAESKNATEIKNYLTAIINATTEWKEKLNYDLSEYEELLVKIKELNEKSGAELISAIKQEIENNSSLRKLMQGHNIFGSDILMSWITCEAELLNERSFGKEKIRENIKETYSPYTLKTESSNRKAMEEINSIITKKKLEDLTSASLQSFIDELRKFESELNMYGQLALENYISSIIDYVATKTISESNLNLDKLTENSKVKLNQIELLSEKVRKLLVFANYGVVDIKTVLETIPEFENGLKDIQENEKESYKALSADLERYASYLIMSKLYNTDLENNKDVESLKNFLNSTLESEKEDTWALAFSKLDVEVQSRICENILDIYYFDEAAREYENYIEALNDFLSLPVDPDALNLALNSEIITPELSQIVKANDFVTEYFYLQQQIEAVETKISENDNQVLVTKEEKSNLEKSINDYDLMIEALLDELEKAGYYSLELIETSEETTEPEEDVQTKINDLILQIEEYNNFKSGAEIRLEEIRNIEKQKVILEEEKGKLEIAYEELIKEDTNGWSEFIKDYSTEDTLWLTMCLAGENQFFIYLQSVSLEDYEQIVKKLGENVKEKLSESNREYLESSNDINKIVEKYCGILDGDVEAWVDSFSEYDISDEEKAKIIAIINGTDIASNYYTYEEAKKNILNFSGATQLLHNRINELRENVSSKIFDVYITQNKKLSDLQVEYSFIESEINLIKNNDISWVTLTKSNGIKSDSSMDDKTKAAFSKWIDTNENSYEKMLEEKLQTCEKHLQWLNEKAIIDEDSLIEVSKINGSVEQYLENMNRAYAKYLSVHDCASIAEEIKSLNKSYELLVQDKESIKSGFLEKENKVKENEIALKKQIKLWEESVNKLIEVSNDYNKKVEAADVLFSTLKKAEKAKRIAEEIHEYATSVYLKNLGEVAEKEYISPQEKQVIAQYNYDRALIRVRVLENVRSGEVEASEKYTSAMKSYEEAVKRHYEIVMIKTETDKGLAIQEDIVREADAKLQVEYNKIINTNEIFNTDEILNTDEIKKLITESYASKFVYITKKSDNTYSVRLKKNGEDCYDILKDYLVEKNVKENIAGAERVISQGVYDARNWVAEVNSKGEEYLKDLVIAALYITNKEYSFSSGDMPNEVHGVNFEILVKECKEDVIKSTYDKIMAKEGGEEDLAKYLMFNYCENNKIGLIVNVFTETFIENALAEKVFSKAKESVVSAYENKKGTALGFEIMAAQYTAAALILWIPNPVLLGLAAAAATTAIVFEVQANKIKKDVLNHVKDLIKGRKDSCKIQNVKNAEILKNISEYKAELEEQTKVLNKMYTGSEIGSVSEITTENILNALKARAEKLSISYDEIINNLYTADVLKASGAMEEKKSTDATSEPEDKNTLDNVITEAINKVNAWYAEQEELAKTKLDNVINDLKRDQGESKKLYDDYQKDYAELTEAQKDKLHELALKVSDESLSVAEKETAKAEYEKYKEEILNTEKAKYEAALTEYATQTFGTGTWSTDVYLKDMHKLWEEVFPENVDFTNNTENYTQKAIENFRNTVLKEFDVTATRQLEILEEKQNKERQQLATKRKNWEDQMSVLITIAESEWDKAGESLVSGYNTWKKEFDKELAEKNAQWYENYENFLEAKQEWINDQYLYAVNVANAKIIDQSGLDVESTIAEALANTAIEKINNDSINVEEYTETLIGETALSQIMNSIESLENKGKNAAITRKHGYKINTSSREAMLKAEETMQAIEVDLKEAAAKLAAEQANRIIEQTIAASMERIEKENEGMREWEENLVRSNGYTVEGKNIKREAPVDSTIWETIYETQTVAYYQDFTTSKPVLSVSLASTMLEGLTSSGIMQIVSQANKEIENWSIEIFGDTEEDENGNVVQKQWTIPRSDSKALHATGNTEVKTAYEKLMNDEQNQQNKKRYEELSKKDKLSDDENKELIELSRSLVTVRDGKLGEWIGYAPLFNSGESLDLNKNKESNIADYGLGQMGAIMLDFQWNSMRASQGWAKLALPAYDQPLWKDNGGWFEPPTIRSVSSVVIEIVGVATGQAWWFSYADDLLFAAMDLGAGYKSASEVGLELAKTAATAAIGAGMGAASNALGDIAGNALQGASKFTNFAAQAGISMTTNYVTSVANSAINSVYIGENGKLGFHTEGFTKSLYSANTIGGAIGAGVTGGLNASTIGYNNQYVTGFNSQQIGNIQSLNSLVGGLATNATSLLMGGNANFNLLSYKGVGMLEFSFGKDGISSKIGMGGTNISYQNLVSAFGGVTHLHVNRQIDNTEYDKTTQDALKSQYGYGDEQAKAQLDDIINGDTVLKFDAEGSEVAQSVTENGQKIIHINSTLNDGFIDLGLTLQHEAHRDGIVSDEQSQQIETTNAVLGHTVMAKKMQNDSLYKSMMNDIIDNNQNLQNDLAVFDYAAMTGDWGAFGSYANAAYDSSADYWKLLMKADGSHELVFDEFDKNNDEFDKKKELSIDYLNENGEVISTSVPENQDMTGIGMAESLTTILGSDRAEEILKNQFGIDAKSVNDVPNEIMASVMGWSIETVNSMPDHIKASILAENKDAIMGELLMTQMGASWNGSSWINTEGISLTITDKAYNGNIMAEVQNGKYLYSTVNATLFRDPNSWNSVTSSDGINWEKNTEYYGLDSILYEKQGINYDYYDSLLIDKYQTVDNLTGLSLDGTRDYAQPYYNFATGNWIQGNTIVSRVFNMGYYHNENAKVDDWRFSSAVAMTNVLQINNATTLSNINTGNNGGGDLRWLEHDDNNLLFQYSDGCFVTTVDNQKELLERLKNWNTCYGYQIKTTIY